MAVSVSGTITADILVSAVDSLDLGAERKASVSKVLTTTFASGVGLNQLDRLFFDERTIAGSGTDALDFNGGGLVDALNTAWAPARLKFLVVLNLGPNDIQVVRPASNGIPLYLAAGDGEQIPLNGLLVKVWPSAAGIVVTAGTGDLLNIINTAAGTITYQIIAGGASA
jgi:hypothetical protein